MFVQIYIIYVYRDRSALYRSVRVYIHIPDYQINLFEISLKNICINMIQIIKNVF